MTPAMVVICSGLLTFGVPLFLALREIFKTGPGDGGSWRPNPPPPEPVPPVTLGPGGVKKLPDCLIPKLPPRPAARPRVLENV